MRTITLLGTMALAAVMAAAPAALAPDVRTREITYIQKGTKLQGFLAWDQNAGNKRPGVLVVHEWWGHDEHARTQAKRLAESGYVALALDMYGDGKHADHPEDAQKFAAEATKDPAVAAARFNAAKGLLMAESHVDPARIAAIGYCFGGGVVLNMARAGADLKAVVSFHGALETDTPAERGKVKAPILVLTGADDPFNPPDVVEKFRKEMTDAGANFRIVSYPGVKHSFTNPQAETHGMPQLAYNADADKKSWQEMLALFKKVF